ncbi:amidase [Paenibacillus sp. LMG 31461]|uniref:Amidase n=1 Tax=Paenibacillus plantarum TaxID=2654975 RepID=A0ABX1XI73_9BACL|nr:amidase [Paenibacillus plantarum]NOU67696.1 amidase [Paenibacillus plantarum]
MENEYGAFVTRETQLEPTGIGVLKGKTFAVKDVFAIKGHVSGAGNPDWLRTHSPAERTSRSIAQLLQAGAQMTGITNTDELMFSLSGENIHYGTPVNPRSPDCLPGGSSSGSAVAVAAGLVDFALGTDTAGSVRIPASYCGIYGFRPTQGIVSTEGVIPLAQSFDTVGWFANDAKTMLHAGEALIETSGSETTFQRVIFPEEAWALASPRFEGLPEAWIQGIEEMGLQCEWKRISANGITEWMNTFRVIQGCEIWQNHGDWIEQEQPDFAPDIRGRFEWAKQQALGDREANLRKRDDIQAAMEKLLSDDGLLIIPTAPGEAPKKGMSENELSHVRLSTLQLTCIAGLSGLPQLHIPLESSRGFSIGLSVIAGKNQDVKLLKWVNEFVKNPKIELVAHARV